MSESCWYCFMHDMFLMNHVPIIYYLEYIKHRLEHLGILIHAGGQVAAGGGAPGVAAGGNEVEPLYRYLHNLVNQ